MGRTPIVLAVDSQEWKLRSVESVIGPRGFAVVRAYTGRQALDALGSVAPDAVLLGEQLADMDAASFLDEFRQRSASAAAIPVIVTTSGVDSAQDRLDLFRRGAWLVVVPPVEAEALLAQLETFVRAKMFADQAREASLIDEETGLYSLRGLSRRAREVAAEAYRREAPLTCVVLAPTDEEDAAALASALRAVGRSSDLIGRVGPAQFAVVASGKTGTAIEALIARLEGAMQRAGAHYVNLRVGSVDVQNFRSAGIAVDDLFVRAAESLHRRSRLTS